MPHPLIQHIYTLTGNDAVEELSILKYFSAQDVKKKADLILEGQTCRQYFFVVKGCLRLFFLDQNGVEQTIQFALENWWMTDLDAFKAGKKSAYTVQAIEASEVLAIDYRNYEKLLAEYPVMEKYFRKMYERAYAASLFRIKYISRLSKSEFYKMFITLYPAFVQRIPQKILASFLGFTPEYLSELRKKPVR